MKGPSPRAWISIKKRFEAAESVSSVAKRFKTTRQTIRRRAIRDNWVVDSAHLVDQVVRDSASCPQQLARAVKSSVIAAATSHVLSNPENITAVEDMATTLRRQSAFASQLTTIAETFLRGVLDGTVTHAPHLSRGSLLMEVINVCSAAQGYARLCGGLKSGQPNVRETTGIPNRRHFTVETPAEKIERLAKQDAANKSP